MATTDREEEHQPDVSVAPLSLSISSPTTASAATMSAESPSTESPAVPTIDTEILVSELVFYTVKAEAVETIWADFPARYHSVKTLAVMLKRKASENEIKAEYWYDLQRLIWAFFNVEDLKVLHKNKSSIQNILSLIANPIFLFPPEYVEVAKMLTAKFEEDNWGEAPRIEENEAKDSIDEEHKPTKKKMKTPVNKSKVKQITRVPPPTHRIFGATGIMKGILISIGATKAYSIDKTFHKKASDVFGANGLTVGDWWPLQIAALRDGAHGSRIGGISGAADHGCRSIVVGKSYEDLDHDTGYKLFYSSVQGTTITAVRENAGTKALLQSQETSKPVRVLRAAGCKWPGAPRVGIRYDGLYRVVSSTFVERGEKEIYMQFELVRLDSEDPIDRSKPTLQQEMLYMEVFKGY